MRALTEQETAILLNIIRDLQNHGIACIYISHKLNEVKAISDTICVIRDGQHIGTRNADGTPAAEWWTRNQWCSRLCMLGSDARITLSDGRLIARTLAVLPDCALPCS